MEFAIVASLLFVIFLGMLEVGRAMMVLGSLSNAARNGVRAGAVTSGDYSSITQAVDESLKAARITGPHEASVKVDDVTVHNDSQFSAHAHAGAKISVEVRIHYRDVSWLPVGSSLFFPHRQVLTETAVMRREF